MRASGEGICVVQARPVVVAHPRIAPAGAKPASSSGSLSQVLFSGGDARLDLDPATGVSRYGCRPYPDTDLAAFGSSTASTVSERAYAAAEALWERFALAPEPLRARLAQVEMARLRLELIQLCGLSDLQGLDVLFAPSGTDLHLIVADLFTDRLFGEAVAILPDPAETGSGVPAALTGRHFGAATPTGTAVEAGARVQGLAPLETISVALRGACGAARPAAAIDAEIEYLAKRMLDQGRQVLLVMVDGSKTGMIAPTPACAERLKAIAPDRVQVLVDACQFRIAPQTLRAYLDRGFLVAVTGSKFLTGPTFAGALLVPPAASGALARRGICEGLADYCAVMDWPADWAGSRMLRTDFNLGLMMRWEAALAELRAFQALPNGEVKRLFERFGRLAAERLAEEPALEALPTADLGVRLGQGDAWDSTPTILPFLLRHVRADAEDGVKVGELFNRDETQRVYAALRRPLSPRDGCPLTAEQRALPVELGQPVALGVRDGTPISALRLCMSARLTVDALSGGETAMIRRAMDALAKTAEIAWRVSNGAPL